MTVIMFYYSIGYFPVSPLNYGTFILKEFGSFCTYLPTDQSHGAKPLWINSKMANEERFSPPILKAFDSIFMLSGLKWDYLGVRMSGNIPQQVFAIVRDVWRH